MSQSSFPLFTAGVLTLALQLQGCGGAADDTPVASATAAASSTATVRLEGCVVDPSYVPDEGVPVHVRSIDGRTLAKTASGRWGEFVVQVPTGVATEVSVDRIGGEWFLTPALERDRQFEACLVARQ